MNIKIKKCDKTGMFTATSNEVGVVANSNCPMDAINKFKKEASNWGLKESLKNNEIVIPKFSR